MEYNIYDYYMLKQTILVTMITLSLLGTAMTNQMTMATTMPDMSKLPEAMKYATENAKILRELTSMINACTDDVSSYQFKIFDKCMKFMEDYNISLKQLQSKYPETIGGYYPSQDIITEDLRDYFSDKYTQQYKN